MSSPLPGETGSWFGARDVTETSRARASYGEHLIAKVCGRFIQYPSSFESNGVRRLVSYLVPVPVPVSVFVFVLANIVLHLPCSVYVRFAARSVPAALCLITRALQQQAHGALGDDHAAWVGEGP
jgi:hypothetical protein